MAAAALLAATLPLNALKVSADTPVVITQQCSLSRIDVHYGDTVSASGVLQNTGSTAVTLLDVVLAGRPPGGVNSGGPYADFAPAQQNVTLAAGESRLFYASRTFGSPDPVGAGWRCYITFETTDSVYHDGADTPFSVTSVVFSQQCILSSSAIHYGDTLTATGSLQNAGDTAVTLPNVVLANRRPGGTNQGGPYDDFSPEWYNVKLGAGQTQTFTATRTFTSSDPTGGWRCYLTFQTSDGAYHDGTNTAFTLAALGRANVTEFPIPTAASQLLGITAGPDGNLWFTEKAANQIGRMTPSGAVTEFPIPTPNSNAGEITAGPDGNLWFTEGIGKIGRLTPVGNVVITEFNTPTQNPDHITAGPDGNVWFTESSGFAKIARITPVGAITEFPTLENKGLYGITSGSDGNLWFTTWGGLGRITPAGQITYVGPRGRSITAGPDGNLWFTQPSNQYDVGRTTPDGVVTFFATPTANNYITAGPDRNLWFSETSNRIGQITLSGALTEFDLPTPNSGPGGITAGPDRNIWFIESSANQIGRLEVTPLS